MSNRESYEKLLDNIERVAYEYQLKYRGCSQTCLKALQENLRLGNGMAFKAACCFTAGFARMGEICGALAGGTMGIALAFGRESLEEHGAPREADSAGRPSRYSNAMSLAVEYRDWFKKEFGTVKCWPLQERIFGRHFDTTDPKVREEMKSGEYFDRLSKECSKIVAKSARKAAEIIIRGTAKIAGHCGI